MKNTQMYFYAAAVVGFYASLVLLFANTLSVTGLTILTLSILTLVVGICIQWRSENHSFKAKQLSCQAESTQVQVSC